MNEPTAPEPSSQPRPAPPPATSWETFEADLATALGALRGECLTLSTREGNRFVQFNASPGEGVFTEAVSNAYLEPPNRLDEAQLGALRALGWSPPTHAPGSPAPVPAPDGSPNHFRHFPVPCSCAEVAHVAVRTLAEVLGVESPEALVYKAFDEDGRELTLPVLGLAREGAPSRDVTPPPAGKQPGKGRRSPFQALRARVRAAVRAQTGLAALEYEDGGSLEIPIGSRPGWVHPYERPFFVRVHVHLTQVQAGDEGIVARLHDWNCRAPLARLIHQDGEVYLGVDFPAAPFRAEHLAQAISCVATQADQALAAIRAKPDDAKDKVLN